MPKRCAASETLFWLRVSALCNSSCANYSHQLFAAVYLKRCIFYREDVMDEMFRYVYIFEAKPCDVCCLWMNISTRPQLIFVAQ